MARALLVLLCAGAVLAGCGDQRAPSDPSEPPPPPPPPPGILRLHFQTEPAAGHAGQRLAPVVVAVAGDGGTVDTARTAISLALTGGSAGATLSGRTTTSAANGLASFDSLVIDRAGTGFRLVASASGLVSDTSVAFAIVADSEPPPPPPPPPPVSHRPVLVANGPYSSIVSGTSFSCVLTDGGEAWCWGVNGRGQLGNGTTTPSPTPVQVSGGLRFTQLTAGDEGACGIATDGLTYCWGEWYQHSPQSWRPQALPGGVRFTAIALGEDHGCGLVGDGTAWCWGDNHSGQLGDGTSTDQVAPVRVAASISFTRIRAGGTRTCALTADGTAYCWGHHLLGSAQDPRPSRPGRVHDTMKFIALGPGRYHSCFVAQGGQAYCWGHAQEPPLDAQGGLLGDGRNTNSDAMVAVAGGHTFAGLDNGNTHTCAVKPGGALWCWGHNEYGQLGTGTTTVGQVPVAVADNHAFKDVAADNAYTCALDGTGKAWCWGRLRY